MIKFFIIHLLYRMINEINNIMSLDELHNLHQIINKRIKILEKNNFIEIVKKDIDMKGFSIQNKGVKLGNYKYINLRYDLDIKFQAEWVKLLDFNYIPNRKDSIKSDGGYDYVKVQLYFPKMLGLHIDKNEFLIRKYILMSDYFSNILFHNLHLFITKLLQVNLIHKIKDNYVDSSLYIAYHSGYGDKNVIDIIGEYL